MARAWTQRTSSANQRNKGCVTREEAVGPVMRPTDILKSTVGLTALAAAMHAAPALAQTSPVAEAETFFESGGVYLDADQVISERDTGRYIARGNVEARYEARVLRAGEVIYEPETGRAFASGGVTIIEPNGTVEYADKVELTDELTAGVAQGFAARLPNEGKVMAAYATRQPDKTNILTNAVYTACPIPDDPESPSWRLRARKVVQDNEAQMIYYRDAVFELKGVPVLYTPYFAHPDPAVERKSGLLLPTLGYSSRTGAWFQQPAYWAIGPSQDLIVAPRVMSKVNPLIGFEYRKRFYSGVMEFEGSFTYEQLFDSQGDKFDDEELRGHVYGSGLFALTDDWSWGFGVERVTDDLYLQRYDLDEADIRRGIYRAERKQLTSQLFTVGQDDDYYASAALVDFQSLVAGLDTDEVPRVLPIVETRRQFDFGDYGRVEALVDAVALQRETGVDYRRGTAGLDWKARWVTASGLVAEPFAQARGDVYHIDDAFDPVTGDPKNGDFTRVLGLGGIDLTYPMLRPGERVDWMFEPRVQLIAAAGDNDEITDFASRDSTGALTLLNQDSPSLDLGGSNLFELNKFTGFDRWEEGLRANVGARMSAFWGDSEAGLFVGQSFRTETDNLPATSGLDTERSDYVIEAEYLPVGGFSFAARLRLDEDDLENQRMELDAGYRGGRIRGAINYLNFSNDFTRRGPQEEARSSFEFDLTDNWSAGYSNQFDFELGEVRRQRFNLTYEDCCMSVSVYFQDRNTRDRELGPVESIFIRFSLKSLGQFGTR